MNYISDNIKQFIVSWSLKVIRLLVRLKPTFAKIISSAWNPFRRIGRIFVSLVLVPIYRGFFFFRSEIGKAYRPAKNKFMLLVTNRFTIHVVVATVVIITGVLNFQTTSVRAETFGEKSLMYKLVSHQDAAFIDEYALEREELNVVAVSYRQPGVLSPSSFGTGSAALATAIVPITGSGAVSALTFSDSAASIAARTESEIYTVEAGDTISTIAEKFGISITTLLWANNLSVRSVLKPGNELTILPVSGVAHTVKSGDTLSSIAKKYGADSEEILAFNKLASANDLAVGESLIVPGGEIQAPAPVSRPIASAPSQPSSGSSSAVQPSPGTGTMVWPSDLRAITQYFGWSHTGLDVDCHYTNNNYAADDGIVQYSGWKNGYGYVVEINHGNGIVTRYGHHASLYVSAGQQVTSGQAIGLCGTTGRSTGTHLHFEVIVNGSYKNPLGYIR
ncbi:MAG: M23 family metallopeptidase [Patescibacteria group bacterium]